MVRLDGNTNNYLKYLYQLHDTNEMNTSDDYKDSSIDFGHIIGKLDTAIVGAARRMYWKDYCLLGYYKGSGYDRVANSNYMIISEYLHGNYSNNKDSDSNNDDGKGNDINTNSSSIASTDDSNSTSIASTDDSNSTTEWYTVPQIELIAGISPQVQHAHSWAKINELYIPDSLRFNKYGLPNKEGCDDFNSRYKGVDDLYAPISVLGGPNKVTFLHIPKNAGTSIRKVFSWLWPPTDHEKGYNCSNHENKFGTTCTCSFWHVPPRYFTPKIYQNRIVFCVVRDPLDKLLSKFKMVNKNVADSSKASQWIKNSIATIYKQQRDEYCHIMNQFEYIWNERGRRTCHHVIRYESNVTSGVNSIIDTYKLNKNHMSAVVDQGSKHHPDVPLTVNDIHPEVAATARVFYWRDYCLLGYYHNNPWVQ